MSRRKQAKPRSVKGKKLNTRAHAEPACDTDPGSRTAAFARSLTRGSTRQSDSEMLKIKASRGHATTRPRDCQKSAFCSALMSLSGLTAAASSFTGSARNPDDYHFDLASRVHSPRSSTTEMWACKR